MQKPRLAGAIEFVQPRAGIERLWEASIRDIELGVVREHAALLVWERGNLRLTNIVEGTDDEVEPSYQLAVGQQFVGTFHTHPYVTGMMGMAFSGADIASALADGENLSIVHSGNQISGLARTELTPKFVDTETIENSASASFRSFIHYFPLPIAILKMNLALCKRYRLAFYSGNTTGRLRLEFRP
jgi:hypothetical protein